MMSSDKTLKDVREGQLAELRRLNHRIRAMVNDEPAVPHQLKNLVQKQNEVKGHLERETMNLASQLECFPTKSELADAAKKDNMLLEYDDVRLKLDSLKTEYADLKMNVKLAEKSDRKEKRTKQNYTENSTAILENHLQVEVNKLGDVMSENKKLKNQMDHFLLSRKQYGAILHKLMRKHEAGKKIINDIIEQSIKNQEQRKEAAQSLKIFREKDKQSSINNSQEMQELWSQVEHVSNVNEFVRTKARRRISQSDEVEKAKNLQNIKTNVEKNYADYSKLVADMKEKFVEDDTDQLVVELKKLDGDNYNMYTFSNNVNQKLDHMQAELQELQKKIAETRKKIQFQHNQQLEQNKSLHFQLQTETANFKSFEDRLAESKQQISMLLTGIQELVHITSCDTSFLKTLLGKQTSVKINNFREYLQCIEQRLLDMCLVSTFQIMKTTPRKLRTQPSVISFATSKAPPKARLPKTPCPLCAELRDISMVDKSIVSPLDSKESRAEMGNDDFRSTRADLLHSIAECPLAKSRAIIQRRIH